MLSSNLKWSQILIFHLWNGIIILCIVLRFQTLPSFSERKRKVLVEKWIGYFLSKSSVDIIFLSLVLKTCMGTLSQILFWEFFECHLISGQIRISPKTRLYFYICAVCCFIQWEIPLKLIALFPHWVPTQWGSEESSLWYCR